jgi:hypothetical protein
MRYLLATATLGAALLGTACSGDDTNPPAPEAGTGDATVTDGGGDAHADASADATLDAEDAYIPPCTPHDAAGFTDAEIQAGEQIVIARKCEQCHGMELQGNRSGVPSATAEGGLAYPPDLTPDPVNGLGCWTDSQIQRAFLHGIDNEGQPLCNPMPHFGELGTSSIDDAGALEVLAYLRTIPIVVDPYVPNTPACPVPSEDAGEDSGTPDSGVDAGDASSNDAGDASSNDAGDASANDAGIFDSGSDGAG